jgi:hypothetical protein
LIWNNYECQKFKGPEPLKQHIRILRMSGSEKGASKEKWILLANRLKSQ